MEHYTKETIVHNQPAADNYGTGSSRRVLRGSQRGEYVIYYIVGVLEVLLALRFILKLTGANPLNGFVNFIYAFSNMFTSAFENIFRLWFGPGAVTTAVFEPSTLVAMVVYGIVGWGIVRIIQIISGQSVE